MMMVFASHIGRFVSAHPTIKMLALSFLILVGVALIVGGVVLVKLGAAPATRPDPAGSLADDHVRTEVAADTQAVLE